MGDEEESEDEVVEEIEKVLNMASKYVHGLGIFEELDRPLTLAPPKPPIEGAPKLELKPHQRTYAMLTWKALKHCL